MSLAWAVWTWIWFGFGLPYRCSRDGPWPDPSILLTRSKYEANRYLTLVLFDPTQCNFFLLEGEKIEKLRFFGEIFLTQTKGGWPTHSYKYWLNTTRVNSFWTGPITKAYVPVFTHRDWIPRGRKGRKNQFWAYV